MTVEKLISLLGQFDPNSKVKVEVADPTDWVYKVDIENIYLGSPDSEDDIDVDQYDDEGEYIGEYIVLLNIGTV
jgi:hypothetical protein